MNAVERKVTMIAKRNGKCHITGERIIAGVTVIENVNGAWRVPGVPTIRERQEVERQERTAKGLLDKVFANDWRVWNSSLNGPSDTGGRHPSTHHELGCVALCPDGRYGIIMAILHTGDRVQVGRALDFDIHESAVFLQSEVNVIGLVAIPNGKGGYTTQSL
jgi:hypothetical protein